MTRNKITIAVFLAALCVSLSANVFAHPGRTDSNGGHWNRKTGVYHYHNGGGSSSGSSGSGKTYSAPKTVYATKINVSNMPSTLSVGESVNLEGHVYPSNAEDQSFTWESGNTAVATVDKSGKLTAVRAGTVVISAKTSRGTTSRFTVTVKEVAAKSIAIEGKKSEMTVGEKVWLSVAFVPENTTNQDVEWKVDNAGIASVDAQGKLTALALGKTTVYAIHNELTDSFEIEVKPILAKSIEIQCMNEETKVPCDSLSLEEGETVEVFASVMPDDTTDATVKWSSDNTDVAQVEENGVITAIAEGTATITAETNNGIKDIVTIEVHKTPLLVTIIAVIVVLLICAVIIGAPIFLVIWIVRKIRKRK